MARRQASDDYVQHTIRSEQPAAGSVLPTAEYHDVDTTVEGDLPELQQHVEWGPSAIKVHPDGPVLTHELPTKLAVCRTLVVLGPERILPKDERRSRALIVAGTQPLRLAQRLADLQLGGAGTVSGGNSTGGPAFSTSGGGTGGFLCPVGVPIYIVCYSEVFACSADYGVGNNASLASIMVDQWAD